MFLLGRAPRVRFLGVPMEEPEVFDWDDWEKGKTYKLTNDELVGALLSEVSALRKRVKALEDRQGGLITEP